MPALPRNGDSPVDPTNINPFITAGIFPCIKFIPLGWGQELF
jgi:hypothetical protein